MDATSSATMAAELEFQVKVDLLAARDEQKQRECGGTVHMGAIDAQLRASMEASRSKLKTSETLAAKSEQIGAESCEWPGEQVTDEVEVRYRDAVS